MIQGMKIEILLLLLLLPLCMISFDFPSKPTNDVKFKVKIPFQVEAHILHNQANPVPTGNFEEKPKPVTTGVRVIEINTGSFFTTIERWRDREELLGWVRRQAARAGFTISIDKSITITPYMTM